MRAREENRKEERGNFPPLASPQDGKISVARVRAREEEREGEGELGTNAEERERRRNGGKGRERRREKKEPGERRRAPLATEIISVARRKRMRGK